MSTNQKSKCYHCGATCEAETIIHDDKSFCCSGCANVYNLFEGTELEDFYNQRPSITKDKYDFLKEEQFAKQFLIMTTDDYRQVRFYLPAIHCSSCLYILENLYQIDPRISRVIVNFGKKTATIVFNPKTLLLSELAYLLASIGYSPDLSRTLSKNDKPDYSEGLKIGIAGFCLGNIMLFSFPEYLGFTFSDDPQIAMLFRYLSLILVLPLTFYAGNGYLNSAIKGIKYQYMTIDIPIALGMMVLLIRSAYEVLFVVGSGYMDSLAGLIFFLLIGKWFQGKTYAGLSFNRDYTSYFPLSVARLNLGRIDYVPIQDLREGDHIIVRDQEIIPCDSILLDQGCSIDYSFVTGEKRPIAIEKGDLIYAGGKVLGTKINAKVKKPSSSSYLSDLWSEGIFKEEKNFARKALTEKISQYFTPIILLIAIGGAAFWYFFDVTQIWQVIAAILIVACPCALALSAPFTNGNSLRYLGRNGLFLKKSEIAESLSDIDTIVLDKTGTITTQSSGDIKYVGAALDEEMKRVIKSMTSNSSHPLSVQITQNLNSYNDLVIENFTQIVGSGLQCYYGGNIYQLGSAHWLGVDISSIDNPSNTVFFAIDGWVVGHFQSEVSYRQGIGEAIQTLSQHYNIVIASGDNDSEKSYLSSILPDNTIYLFNQSPKDKLQYIAEIKKNGHKVMMIGDGLNDAGALQMSDIGIAVTDSTATFSPACDAILEGNQLKRINDFITYSKRSKGIIATSFVVSFLYNAVGLSYALSGALTPVVAALLMPLSSVSVVLLTTLLGNQVAKKLKL